MFKGTYIVLFLSFSLFAISGCEYMNVGMNDSESVNSGNQFKLQFKERPQADPDDVPEELLENDY